MDARFGIYNPKLMGKLVFNISIWTHHLPNNEQIVYNTFVKQYVNFKTQTFDKQLNKDDNLHN